MVQTTQECSTLQKVSLLIVGDEILNGKIQDINGYKLGRTLRKYGTQLHKVSVVGDALPEIVQGLQDLASCSHIILVSGGLGPTQDDKTRYGIAEYLGVGGGYSEEARLWRQEFLAQKGRQDPEDSVQNWIPNHCKPLKNPMGTACGIFLEQDDTSIYAFPGVPREFDAMVEEYVRPLLLGKSSWEEKKIWTWGWGESQQKEAFQGITIPVPFIFSSLPRAQGVVLSLGYPVSNDPDDSNTSLAIQHEALWKEIVRCIPKGCIVDLDGKNVLESIQETLLKQKACVATAESCTGGYIGQLLTSVPGISSVYKEGYITYSNKSKETLLGVNAKTLELYGAVSQETVAEMAVGTLKKSAAQYACAVSGIAGPGGGSDTKPVGTVWMAVGSAHDVITEKCVFWGNREEIRRKSAYYTLHLLQKYLLKK